MKTKKRVSKKTSTPTKKSVSTSKKPREIRRHVPGGPSDPEKLPFNRIWFDEKLRSIDISQRTLAKLMGTSATAITLILKGDRRISAQEAVGLAKVFGVGVGEVLANSGIPGAITGELGGSGGLGSGGGGTREVLIAGWVNSDGVIVMQPPKDHPVAPVFERDDGSGKVEGFGDSVLRYQTLGASNSSLRALDGALAYFRGPKEKVGGLGEVENGKPNVKDSRGNDEIDLGSIGRLSVVRVQDEWRIGVLSRGYQAGTFNLAHMDGAVIFQNKVLEFARPVGWLRL